MTAAGPRWSRRSASAGDAVVRPRLRGRGAQLSLSLCAASHPQLRRVPHGPDAGRAGGAPGHGPGPCAVVRGRVLPHLHRARRDGVRPGPAAAPFSSGSQRFRPYRVGGERIAGILLILLGLLLVPGRFTLLAGWLQELTPEFLKSRL